MITKHHLERMSSYCCFGLQEQWNRICCYAVCIHYHTQDKWYCIMVCGRIKGSGLEIICYPVNNWLWHSFVVISVAQIKCETIKETQTRRHLIQQSIHPLVHTRSFRISNSDNTNFHQPIFRRVKLHTFQLGLADNCCEAILVWLAMVQSTLRAYNVNNQLVSSIKSMFVESPNAGKVTQVGKVNLFWLNGMETQGFPSAKLPVPFCGAGPAV